MLPKRRLQEIQRQIDEHKAGFLVEADPWELVEELLEENELLRMRLRNPDAAAWEVG